MDCDLNDRSARLGGVDVGGVNLGAKVNYKGTFLNELPSAPEIGLYKYTGDTNIVGITQNLIPTASSIFDTDGTAYWSGLVNATKTYNATDKCMRLTYTAAGGSGVYKGLLVAGQRYVLRFKARQEAGQSNKRFTTVNGSTSYKINPILTTEWQDYQFEIINTEANMVFLANIDPAKYYEIKDIVLAKAEFFYAKDRAYWDGATWTMTHNPIIDVIEYGFYPTATAAQNMTAINAAIASGGNYKVSVAGVYEMSNSIVVPSDTKLTFVQGCSIKKMANYPYVIINKNATTALIDDNIEIFGNGLTVIVNGYDSIASLPVYGLRGQVSLFKCSRFILDGLTCSDIGVYQWFIQIAEVGNALTKSYINNIDVIGEKDGIHFGVAQNIELNYINTTCYDDGIAFNAIDYPDCNPTFGDIKNITVNNWTDKFKASQIGYGCRLLGGAWAEWTTGNEYKYGDNTTYAGNIYKKISSGTQSSSVAPTHTTGQVTGADGVTWIWSQAGTHTAANIDSITLVNCKNESARELVAITTDDSIYCRSIYPDTFDNYKVDNIVIDNCDFDAGSIWIWSTGNVGKITVKNTDLLMRAASLIFTATQIDNLESSVEELVFDNCTLDYGTTNARLIDWGYPATLAKVTMKDVNVFSNVNNSVDGMLKPNLAGQLTTVDLIDCEFNNIPCLLRTWITGCAVTINAVRTKFLGLGRIIQSETYGTGNYVFNGTDCTFQTPTNALFDNMGGEAIFIDINTTGSIGVVESGKVFGGVVDVTDCDLVA